MSVPNSPAPRIVHYSKDGVALEPDEGFAWMRVTDHLAAVAEAKSGWRWMRGYEQGAEDERLRILEAIENVPAWPFDLPVDDMPLAKELTAMLRRREVLAVIDPTREGGDK